MPLPDDYVNTVVEEGGVEVKKFSVSPSSIGPFDSATLAWDVSTVGGITIKINGGSVSTAGSTTVQPTETTIYSLTAYRDGRSVVLQQVTLSVDLSTCTEIGVPVSTIASVVKGALESAASDASNRIKLSSSDVRVSSAGISISAVFGFEIVEKGAFQTTLEIDLDCLVNPYVNTSGDIAFKFSSFDLSSDLDSTWWLGLLYASTVGRLAEEILDALETSVKSSIRSELKSVAGDLVGKYMKTGMRIQDVWTDKDEAYFRVCPE